MRYVDWLRANGSAVYGIHSKVAVLAAAWNRVRHGHRKCKRRVPESLQVGSNPWEAIKGDLPIRPTINPVQVRLDRGEFQTLHGAFEGRPVAQSLLVFSLWTGLRLWEVVSLDWGWMSDGGFFDVPDDVAKWGKGRVVRVPPALCDRLVAQKVLESPLVFAAFRDEQRASSKRSQRMAEATPDRLYDTVGKAIASTAARVGLTGVTHHALRRTTMELSDQGEEIRAIDRSSKNLGTTTRNKLGFYVKKEHGRTAYLRADALYVGLSMALAEDSGLADLMMVESHFRPDDPDAAVGVGAA